MDNIWDKKIFRSRRSLAVVAGMENPNDHAEPTKVERTKKVGRYVVFCFSSAIKAVLIHTFSVISSQGTSKT
mgnify:CR=1 FL=1